MEERVFTYKYPRPAVTTDCVIFGFDGTKLQVLLVERGAEPYKGRWAFPGGFLNIDESCEEGALRELQEETGLDGAYIEQFHTFSDPGRDPRGRVITVAYYALVRMQDVRAGDDAAKAEWFALGNVPPLAFDHGMILSEAIKRLRERIHFEPVGLGLLAGKFTMRQLQNLYEAILDVHFDSSVFAGKMLRLNILRSFGDTVRPAQERNAVMYSFDEKRYNELKRRGLLIVF